MRFYTSIWICIYSSSFAYLERISTGGSARANSPRDGGSVRHRAVYTLRCQHRIDVFWIYIYIYIYLFFSFEIQTLLLICKPRSIHVFPSLPLSASLMYFDPLLMEVDVFVEIAAFVSCTIYMYVDTSTESYTLVQLQKQIDANGISAPSRTG